ncbi:MAG: hypothetical protein ACR2O6_06525 [Ilumatobacteraceae bacterium]
MTTTDHRTDQATHVDNPRRAAGARSHAARAERRLRRVLAANATTSIVAGAAMAIAAGSIDDLLGTGHAGWVRIVGIAVVLFGVDVAWLARRPRQDLVRFTPVVIAADAVWVVLSVATLLLGWFDGAGIAAVIAMAVAVDTYALLQFGAWRTLRTPR